MADNITLNPGTGGPSLASKDIGGVQFQKEIIALADGTLVDATNRIPTDNAATVTVSTLLNAVTTTQTGSATAVARGVRTYQATVSGTGTVTATVKIYGNSTNSNSGGILIATISLSGTTSSSDGFASNAPWPYAYADLTAISGTSAAVTARVSV